jgi:DNA-binding MarR family transcriptional regulator
MTIRFTLKQIEILKVIQNANPDGTLCSVYDIMDNLSYEVRRDAVLHSIRILVEAGYVERRDRVKRGTRSIRVFCVTTKAAELL